MLSAVLMSLQPFLPLTASLLCLYFLSSLAFQHLLGGIATSLPRASLAQKAFLVLRAPGNIVHESSHALATLLSGYRVAELRFCFQDPQGRGWCRPGRPFAPWAHPLLVRLLSGLAPLAAGTAVIGLLARWTGVPIPDLTSLEGPDQLVTRLAEAVSYLSYREPFTWVFLVGSLFLAAEAHPSGTDLKLASLPLLLLFVVYGSLGILATQIPATEGAISSLLQGTGWVTGWMTGYVAVAATGLALGLIALGLPLLVLLRWAGR